MNASTLARGAAHAVPALLCSCFYVGSLPNEDPVRVGPRLVDVKDVAAPDEYEVDVVAAGLSLPVGITFDDEDRPYVVEAGYAYDELFTTPRLLRIEPDGSTVEIARGEKDRAPWTGVDFADGAFFIAEGGIAGGRIVRIDMQGNKSVVVDGLPGMGDHHTNGPLVKDGYVYFTQGTATNSAVVGMDNWDFGWLRARPDYHDIPCEDVKVVDREYRTDNPFTPEDDVSITGPFMPFGNQLVGGGVIKGRVPCTGALMRAPVGGGPVELVAWGFRNPFGIAFSPDGKLFLTDEGYDERGSRPVFAAPDLLWEVREGTWHGWPDFVGGRPIDEPQFGRLFMKDPQRVLLELPNDPPMATAFFGVHAAVGGIDFSRSARFGHVGEAFVAEFGDMSPATGRTIAPIGFRVVRVDTKTGVIRPFIANEKKGPASKLENGGVERPVDVAFDRSGDALYVVDFGQMPVGDDPKPQPGTGVVWRVSAAGAPLATTQRGGRQ